MIRLLCILVIVVMVSGGPDRAAYGQAGAEPLTPFASTGKANPFATILKKNRLASEQLVEQMGITEDPESEILFMETVDLNFLEARGAAEAFACLSSPSGKILAQEGRNSLILLDRAEHLKRMVTEIKKADRPVPTPAMRAVALKYLDAKSAAAALARLASGAGAITVAEKSNALILCDTRSHVDAMVAEIERIDLPTSGLVAEKVTLQHVDAKSTGAGLEKLLSEHGSIVVIEQTNTLVVCDVDRNVRMIVDEIRKIDQPVGGLSMETVNLRFLTAVSLVPVVQKMLTRYGMVAANETSNSVVVCDTAVNLGRVVQEIRKADRTPQPILVEVVLLDVAITDDKEIGVNWDLLKDSDDVVYRQDFDISRVGYLSGTVGPTGAGVQPIPFASLGAGGDISLISGSIRHAVHALQQKRDVQILASPRTLVVSGQKALIQAVEEIPYQQLSSTSGGGSMTSTVFKNVGVTLEVTATVTDANDIFLAVSTEQNVQTGVSGAEQVPVVDTRRETTSLLLKDGQTVVMGGLRRQTRTRQASQVPVMGDLPLVGVLFRSTKDAVVHSELVVLLSPRIYRDQPIPEDVAGRVQPFQSESILSRVPAPGVK